MPIRPAVLSDLDTIIELVHGLADYEREPEAVVLDRDEFAAHLFGPRPYAEVFMCETDSGESAGFALFFHNFSTWTGKPGIWLEDLFVRPEFRGRGYGKALLIALAGIAVERGCGPVRMVGAGLERALDRLLPGAGGGPDGRMDDLPGDGGCTGRPRWRELNGREYASRLARRATPTACKDVR